VKLEPYNSISIFPNPTTGLIRIENTEYSIQNVSVYDIYGREVGSVILRGVEGKQTEVDLSTQAQGIYIIRVSTDKQTIRQKVIKQ